MQVPFADIQLQYQHFRQEIDARVQACLASGAYINGPQVKEFAEALAAYLSVEHVIPCGNGTDALQIALMGLNLQPGDEVIVPSFAYISPAEAALLLQLKPVFADVKPDTFMLDEAQLEKYITSRTRTIIPVHLFGQIANMEAILEIARRHNLYVIEDAAQAMGATYTFSTGEIKKAGTIGHIGCTSFFPTKNLGCFGDGGALFTNNAELAGRLKQIANHGQEKKYTYRQVGINSRLDSIQAAVLLAKLPHLDEQNRHRVQIAEQYSAAFAPYNFFSTPVAEKGSSHVYHQYTLRLSNKTLRDLLINYLKEKSISSMIYYPQPLHLQQAFHHITCAENSFPVSEALSETVLSIPVYAELTPAQVDYVIESIAEFENLN
ncbi:DegT/DnrJ/EryC1/StrS family aminotransferase (plasmid) [Pedobacter sp. BS3]|uniref:DegT/DnrJ/EryC1/StrS family aminotransferase n=1 Tax=Pedobacter sp. BS3 TaxID=2567937 RepID=UPI0011EF1B9D|nr:DegT/DnrJ/EryC1/StrS family aminotransferase [Pedobacter sp. BS3]TZF86435.1 DegT/DnrJ/EryC1/StrS family aminotransferase [Pedobacter sp. BS3]